METKALQEMRNRISEIYNDYMQKELNTDEEESRREQLMEALSNIIILIEDSELPISLVKDASAILVLLKEWDVYAYWFKEMKTIVTKMDQFLENLKKAMESKVIGEGKPDTSMGRPIPAKPIPPETPAMHPPSRDTAGNVEIPGKAMKSPVGKGKLNPILKLPKILTPEEKLAIANKPTKESLSSMEPAGQEEIRSSMPVKGSDEVKPLKSIIGSSKLKLKIKPVRILKKPVGDTRDSLQDNQAPGEEQEEQEDQEGKESQESQEDQERISSPTVEATTQDPIDNAIDQIYDEVKHAIDTNGKVARAHPKPLKSIRQNPLLVPKPIKINVPDIDGIDVETELSMKDEGEVKSDTMVIDQDDKEEMEDANIPVKITVNKPPGEAPPSLPDVNSSREDETISWGDEKSLTSINKLEGRDEDDFTPPGWLGETIEAGMSREDDERAQVASSSNTETTSDSGAFSGTIFVQRNENRDGIEEEEQGDLPETLSVFRAQSPESPVRKKVPKKKEKKTKDTPEGISPATATNLGALPASPGVTSQENTDPTTDSMSLFTGSIQNRLREKEDSSTSKQILFGSSKGPSASIQGNRVQPIGSDVDIDSLPETRDGLLQSLIALEGKRFSVERAKKDLKSELEKGALNQQEYQERLGQLKQELDVLVEKIRLMREKVKKLK
ncbi:hypothetical protein GF325_11775 [Candidatus Bathyarchaeota archaeon]|nr:hypothetical protein [Candidatus Bathyarchaeota archaeon]